MKALFRAVDNINANPELNEKSCYKKGDFVVVLPDDHQWGAAEGPPNFVSVVCPEVTVEQAMNYLNSWEVKPLFTVLASSSEGWRVNLTSELPGALKEAGIPLSEARTWLENQGCVFVRTSKDGIVMDVPKTADVEEIKPKLNEVFTKPYRRKRWCISSAAVDWIMSLGGVDVPVTKTQLQTHLKDKAA